MKKTQIGKLTSRRSMLAGLAGSLVLAAGPAASVHAQEGLGTAGNPVEVRIMANEAFANTWQTLLVPEFNKVYPNVRVVFDGVPYTELLAKMMLDATSPNPEYDVLLVDDPWVPQLAEIGALVDLKGEKVAALTGDDYDWGDFNAAPLAAGEWQGVQYAVPVRSNMLLRFYNRTLYEEAGLPEPTPEQTWDEFFADAEKLVRDADGDGKDDRWAIDTYFVREPLTPTIWQSILNANGGSLLDESGVPAFANETGAKSLETHKRLLDYAPPGALGHGFSESLQAFRQGLVANMFNWGSVYKSTAVDPKSTTLTVDEVGIQVLPVGDVQAGAHRGIWIAGVSSKTEELEASWAFLEWLTSKEGESINASLVGSFPARKSTLNGEPAEPWLGPVYETLQQAYDVAAKGKMWRIRSPKSDAAQQILADEIARGLAGQASAEEALDTAAGKIEKALK
ncbi:ABC transporter substrate-binding protein [Oricola indica]|uniref:ABC transporter substrate-binding protein n=1 Tax=Oricola indica TaxID=2872591 RepID=UPI003CCC039A